MQFPVCMLIGYGLAGLKVLDGIRDAGLGLSQSQQ